MYTVRSHSCGMVYMSLSIYAGTGTQGPTYTLKLSGGGCVVNNNGSVTCTPSTVTLDKTAGGCNLKYESASVAVVTPLLSPLCLSPLPPFSALLRLLLIFFPRLLLLLLPLLPLVRVLLPFFPLFRLLLLQLLLLCAPPPSTPSNLSAPGWGKPTPPPPPSRLPGLA